MVGGKTVPQPSGTVRRLPQDFPHANFWPTASGLPSENLLGAFSQRPRAKGLFYLPPPAAFPLFITHSVQMFPLSPVSTAPWCFDGSLKNALYGFLFFDDLC